MNTLWEYKKIGDVCTVERGGSPRPIDKFITEDENGINWIKIGDTTESMYITKTEQKIIPEGIKKSRYVRPGDFLLSNSMSFGRPYILQIDGCIHDGWLVLRDDSDFFDKRFLYYCLSSKTTYEKFKSMAVGGVVNNLNSEMVRNVLVPVPDRVEQCEIADLLDKLTQIISYRKNEIRLLDTLIKARFIEMFGDPTYNPNSYPIVQLSNYIEFLTSGSRGWARYCVDDGKEWFITIKNVKDCNIITDNMQTINAPDNAEAKRTKVKEGDLLISITADLGRTGVVTRDIAEHGAYINQHLICIRLKTELLEPLYVAHYLESPAGKIQFAFKNQSAVKAGLNFNSINSLKLLLPPKELQCEFISFINQVNKSKVAVQKALDETQMLFDCLMQEYFG